jgi:glucose/arabinose dehydrogenase
VVPDDNPFAASGRAGQGDERVWAYGVRNPWRIATDGTSWFVADVGQDAVEEVTVVPATPGPHDLGWPAWEGDRCRVDVCEAQSLAPVATLTHADGACSVIGMAVAARPAADDGAAFWTDYCDTRVWRLTPAGEVVADVALPDGVRATALDVDADGFVVALTADGRILRRVRR